MSDVQRKVSEHFERTAAEFDSIYTGDDKSAFSRLLDRTLRRDMYDRHRLTIEACGEPAGKTILDVGCGTGGFMIPLAAEGAAVRSTSTARARRKP